MPKYNSAKSCFEFFLNIQINGKKKLIQIDGSLKVKKGHSDAAFWTNESSQQWAHNIFWTNNYFSKLPKFFLVLLQN